MDFSVLMPVYYKEKPERLIEAINSLLNQTVKPSEIVLIKDEPSSKELEDTINDYIQKYDDLFQVYSTPRNIGLGNVLRFGVDKCKFPLIARMDSDDIAIAERFEKQLKCFEADEELSVVGGDISEFSGAIDNIIGVRMVPKSNSDIKKFLKYRDPFNHMTVMFKKSDVIRVGSYLDMHHYNEDSYLWIRMHQAGCKFTNLKEVLVYARAGEDMYMRRGGIKAFKSMFELQKYMLRNRVIGLARFLINISINYSVLVLLPNKMRGYIYQIFLRKKTII
jgi:glycosyltransferase involved in cell wall biosynthesis